MYPAVRSAKELWSTRKAAPIGIGEDHVERHGPGAGVEHPVHQPGQPRPGPRQGAEAIHHLCFKIGNFI